MKKLTKLFCLPALLAASLCVNANTRISANTVAFDGKAFVLSAVFGTAYTYGNNTTAYDFTVTFTPVGTSGLPITYAMPAGFYNGGPGQWTFADGVYNVKITPVSTVPVRVNVSVNTGSAYIPAGSNASVTLGNITFYNGGGNVVQLN